MAESDTASTASNSASIEAEDIELLQPYMYEPEYSEDEIPVRWNPCEKMKSLVR